MRILLFTAYFPPDIGSASHLYHELGLALRDQGNEVTVITSLPGYQAHGDLNQYRGKLWVRERIGGMDVIRVATPRLPRGLMAGRAIWQFATSLGALVAGISTSKHDVALVYSPPLPLGLAAWAVKSLRNTPFILNVQDLFPQSVIDLGLLKNPYLVRFFRGMERFLYRRADGITVHSKGNADHVVNMGGSPERVRVMHNWVDTTSIRPGNDGIAFRQKHGLGDSFVVSFAGVLAYSQDLDIVLDAAHLLQDQQDIRWLIVGDGVQKASIVAKAKDRGLDNVVFLPMQPREQYPEVLYASEICLANLKVEVKTPVVPSKILSVMAAGKPIVATMNLDGDAPQLIREAQCGYALSPEEPEALAKTVMELYDDSGLRERLGANGRAFAEAHLSLQRAAEKYAALFKEVAEAKTVSAMRI